MNLEEKKWLKEEIEKQVALAVDPLKPRGWRKLFRIARELAPLGVTITAIVAIILALAGITLAAISQAHTRVAQEAQFEQKTSDRLDALEATLREMRAAQTPSKVLKEIGALNPPQLAKNLSALQTVSQQPLGKVNSSPALLKDVATNLSLVNENTEGYWPAVLHFIQFASGQFAPNAPPPGGPSESVINSGFVNTFPGGTNHVIVKLDGAYLKNLTFVDSRIIFTNNPSALDNVRFVNCVFEFPDVVDPAPSLKSASKDLLASGIQSAIVSGS
jgi:hypothetical protein